MYEDLLCKYNSIWFLSKVTVLSCVTHRPSGSWCCAHSHVPTHKQTHCEVYCCFCRNITPGPLNSLTSYRLNGALQLREAWNGSKKEILKTGMCVSVCLHMFYVCSCPCIYFKPSVFHHNRWLECVESTRCREEKMKWRYSRSWKKVKDV